MADGTMAARIRYLETLLEQMGQQNKTTKMLVTSEVSDVREQFAQQIAEVKQIVMYQEKIYQERIRRLEARVEQLSDFALQIARSSSQTNTMGVIPNVFLNTSSPLATRAEGNSGIFSEEFGDMGAGGPEAVLTKYRDKIDAIYDHYAATATQVASPCMTLSHFTKFARDCNLCGFEMAEPAELLWMAIIRKLRERGAKLIGGGKIIPPPRKDQQVSKHKIVVTTPKTTAPVSRDNFAYERLDEISKIEFPTALLHLAMEKVGKWQPDATQEATLETFLLRDVFPYTDRAIEIARNKGLSVIADSVVGGVSTFSIEEYRTESVKKIIREYISRLKTSFLASVRAVQDMKDGELMTINGFVEFIRRHDLMPSISKIDLRYIFVTCAVLEHEKNPTMFDSMRSEAVSVASLPRLVYHLADRIYGDPLFVTQFPTPEARVEKLLAKMFLLK